MIDRLPDIPEEHVLDWHGRPDDEYYRWLLTQYGVADISKYSYPAVWEALQRLIEDCVEGAEEGSEVRALLLELGAFEPCIDEVMEDAPEEERMAAPAS